MASSSCIEAKCKKVFVDQTMTMTSCAKSHCIAYLNLLHITVFNVEGTIYTEVRIICNSSSTFIKSVNVSLSIKMVR
jgi:hypothetical protein